MIDKYFDPMQHDDFLLYENVIDEEREKIELEYAKKNRFIV